MIIIPRSYVRWNFFLYKKIVIMCKGGDITILKERYLRHYRRFEPFPCLKYPARFFISEQPREDATWEIERFVLRYFADTHKTESDFYLRFQSLDEKDKDFLKAFYNAEDDWKLFELIYKFWNVKNWLVPNKLEE